MANKPIKLNLGRVPFDRAVEYLREKVDIGTEAYTDLLHEAHDRAFVVAGLAKGALLADVHALINDAVQNGKGRDHFQREFRNVIDGRWLPTDKTGQPNTGWRARVIYETNIRTAYAAGKFQQMQRLKRTHPFWRYRHGDSRVARPDHLSWDGLTLRADDPWWQTHYPPNGFGCRCYVVPVSGAEMEDLGKVGRDGRPIPDTPPPSPLRTVKYGDRTIEVPQGVDPGWAYAPGASLEDAARAQTTAKQLDRMPPEIRERVKEELGRGPDWREKTIDELLDIQEGKAPIVAPLLKGPAPRPPYRPDPIRDAKTQIFHEWARLDVLEAMDRGGKKCPVPIVIGDAKAILLEELEKLSGICKVPDSMLPDLLARCEDANAVCISVPDQDGVWKPVKIVMQREYADYRMDGPPNPSYKDGHCTYDPPLPPEVEYKLTMCHEIAHALLPPKTKEGAPAHDDLMRKLISLVFPDFFDKYRRVG